SALWPCSPPSPLCSPGLSPKRPSSARGWSSSCQSAPLSALLRRRSQDASTPAAQRSASASRFLSRRLRLAASQLFIVLPPSRLARDPVSTTRRNPPRRSAASPLPPWRGCRAASPSLAALDSLGAGNGSPLPSKARGE